MLKAHYTLKCTSWLISPDLLNASLTPPTTLVCGALWCEWPPCTCEGNPREPGGLSLLLMWILSTVLKAESCQDISAHFYTHGTHWKWPKIKSLLTFQIKKDSNRINVPRNDSMTICSLKMKVSPVSCILDEDKSVLAEAAENWAPLSPP